MIDFREIYATLIYSYLIRNNGFFASLRLVSRGMSFNDRIAIFPVRYSPWAFLKFFSAKLDLSF